MSTKNLKSKTSEKPLENLWFLVVEHIRNMSTSARFSKTFWKPPANIAPSLVVPLDTYILPRNKFRLNMRPADSQEICWCNRLSLMWCSQHQAQIWDGCDLNVVLMSFEMNLRRIHWMRRGGRANGDSYTISYGVNLPRNAFYSEFKSRPRDPLCLFSQL